MAVEFLVMLVIAKEESDPKQEGELPVPGFLASSVPAKLRTTKLPLFFGVTSSEGIQYRLPDGTMQKGASRLCIINWSVLILRSGSVAEEIEVSVLQRTGLSGSVAEEIEVPVFERTRPRFESHSGRSPYAGLTILLRIGMLR
uniref:Uncharacterized protein n=1 Tax=Anopheles culicifacies TaxID=139723 RepID=A0A182MDW5_9DIPT